MILVKYRICVKKFTKLVTKFGTMEMRRENGDKLKNNSNSEGGVTQKNDGEYYKLSTEKIYIYSGRKIEKKKI